MAIAATMQHTTVRLFIAQFPGNKFANGILFGTAEVFSMLFSNILLLYLDDMVAFRIVFTFGILSYLLLIYCEYERLTVNPWLTNIATLSLMGSIGSWVNINSLIMELRVPPKNIAAVQLLSRTIAVGVGVFSPSIAALKPPYPYIILLAASVVGFFASLRLPKAGNHLQIVKKTDDLKVQIVDP